jgi:ribose 5-phosphate isomerase B
MTNTLVSIASDHRGFHLKTQFIVWLTQNSYTTKDLGPESDDRCDAMEYANKLAEEFKLNPNQVGVLICGSGQAMAMTANRYQYLRAALCTNVTVARLAREHNDANVLAVGADITGGAVALECLEVFLRTQFLGEHYTKRRDRLTALGGL